MSLIINIEKVFCEVENNCLFPYEIQYFSTGFTNYFYDETKTNLLEFNDVFQKSCYPSTFDFSDSSYFSKSKQFSSSFIFSNSDYLPTSTFSSSRKFNKSEEFEATNQFSESNIFTLSNSFSQTYFNNEILNEKTFFKSYLMTNVTVKAVVFSCSNVVSSTFILSYDKNEINAGGLIVSGFLALLLTCLNRLNIKVYQSRFTLQESCTNLYIVAVFLLKNVVNLKSKVVKVITYL